MGEFELTVPLMEKIADRFKVLGDSNRLRILNALRPGERSVSDLVEATELGQANVSKHLQILHSHGFVGRRKEGLYSLYCLADDDVFTLCDLMCGRLASEHAAEAKLLGA